MFVSLPLNLPECLSDLFKPLCRCRCNSMFTQQIIKSLRFLKQLALTHKLHWSAKMWCHKISPRNRLLGNQDNLRTRLLRDYGKRKNLLRTDIQAHLNHRNDSAKERNTDSSSHTSKADSRSAF